MIWLNLYCQRRDPFDVYFRQSLDHVDSRLGNTLGKKWSQPKNNRNHCLCCHCPYSIQPSCCGNWILASSILMLIRNIFLDEQSSVLWFCLPQSQITNITHWHSVCFKSFQLQDPNMFHSLNCLVVSFCCHNPGIQFIFKLVGQKQFVMIHNLWTSLFINKQTNTMKDRFVGLWYVIQEVYILVITEFKKTINRVKHCSLISIFGFNFPLIMGPFGRFPIKPMMLSTDKWEDVW